MMEYAIVIMKLPDEDGGGYVAKVPDLHGCMADGETPQQAASNAQQAIIDWLEIAQEMGREVPTVGSSVKQARAREAALIQSIQILAEQHDTLDDRISNLFNEIQHFKDLVEKQASWSQFAQIVEHHGSPRKPAMLLIC